MTITNHIVLVSIPAWGHLRPLVALACKIVQQRSDIGITLLMGGPFLGLIEKEIGRYIPENTIPGQIRVISILKDILDVSAIFQALENNFKITYDAILSNHPIVCLSSSKTFQDCNWPKPQTVISDNCLTVFKHVRSTTPKSRIFSFNPGNITYTVRLLAPEEQGGYGVIYTETRAVAQVNGEDVDRMATKTVRPINGDIISLPGLPPIYDYELIPQRTLFNDKDVSAILSRVYDFISEADGLISVSSVAYESAGVDMLRTLLKGSQDLYAVGPLLPFENLSKTANEKEKAASSNGSEVEEFLNHVLAKHGRNSLLYVSFGSVHWPPIEYLMKIVEILVELTFPFLITHGSPMAIIPSELSEKVKASGIGLLSPWGPQQLILNHAATSWFLTHCGQNSVIEALAAGIPMIAWPMESDQPYNAINLTLVHNVAYELLEVRTGEAGLKPLLRGAQPRGTLEAIEAEARKVLHAARGPDGEVKRKNVHFIRDRMKAAWEKGGDALDELNKFLSKEFL